MPLPVFPLTLATTTASTTQTVTVNSTGSAPLHVTSVSFTGPNAADFTQTNTCAAAVNPNASCAVTVSYKPAASGTSNATLQIQDDAPNGMQTVAVSGTADDFALPTPSGAGGTQTVSRGSSAMYTLTLSSTNGFAGMVNLACMTTAPASNCNVTTPVSLAANGMANATVTVSPQLSASAASVSFTKDRRPFWPTTVAVLLLALVAFARRQKKMQKLRIVSALGFIALLLAGCSGGSSMQPIQQGPPPGTYTVTVTASSGGRTLPPINLTLIVQ